MKMNHNEDGQELGSHFLPLLLSLTLPVIFFLVRFFSSSSSPSSSALIGVQASACMAGDNVGQFYFPVKHKELDFLGDVSVFDSFNQVKVSHTSLCRGQGFNY